MELFNDKLRTGHYLKSSQLQDDLRIVSRTITRIEEQVSDLEKSILQVPNIGMVRSIKGDLSQRLADLENSIGQLSERLQVIESKKPWWVRLWNFIF